MIDSVASEIGFATWLGYNPIYLAGVDYDPVFGLPTDAPDPLGAASI